MRVDSINQINKIYGAQMTTPQPKPVGKIEKDKVSFSELGKDFQFAYKLAKATPDVRNDKINDIKEKMNTGTYNVGSKEVSEKIASLLDLRG